MYKVFSKDMTDGEELPINFPSRTSCIEFEAAAVTGLSILDSDGALIYSDDTQYHSHSYLINIGNRVDFINTSDIASIVDIPAAHFPLIVRPEGNCTINYYEME